MQTGMPLPPCGCGWFYAALCGSVWLWVPRGSVWLWVALWGYGCGCVAVGGPARKHELGGPKIAWQGGDGMGARRRRGGGVPEMGFRAGPFVLCKDGCCHQRRRNTNLGSENFFTKNFPPTCVQSNDQRDAGIILSHVCWSRNPPPPPARQVGQPQSKPPSRHGDQGGGGGVGQMGFRAIPPPPQSNFLPALIGPGMGCLEKQNTIFIFFISPPFFAPLSSSYFFVFVWFFMVNYGWNTS